MSYIHRIGRTGRGGRAGKAITLFSDDDKDYVRTIANVMKKSGEEVPEWILSLKACDNKAWRKLEKEPTRRKLISKKPKAHLPKAFLKNMDKHIKKHSMAQANQKDVAQFEEEQFEDNDELKSAPIKRQKVENDDASEDGGNWNTVQEDNDDEEIDSDQY